MTEDVLGEGPPGLFERYRRQWIGRLGSVRERGPTNGPPEARRSRARLLVMPNVAVCIIFACGVFAYAGRIHGHPARYPPVVPAVLFWENFERRVKVREPKSTLVIFLLQAAAKYPGTASWLDLASNMLCDYLD